jgi:HEAT repeat protein
VVAAKAITDSDLNLRVTALKAICRYGVVQEMKPALLAALEDSSIRVRYAAASGLFSNADWTREVLPELESIVLHNKDIVVRSEAAFAIGALKEEGASVVSALKTVAENGNSEVAKAARNALNLIAQKKAEASCA